MGKIIIFGAGGRAGRAILAEATDRGHEVTAVVRDLARHADLDRPGVRLEPGDVRDSAQVAALSAGHDAAVQAVTPARGPEEIHLFDGTFYDDAAHSLIAGLPRAGVSRVLLVGHFANLLTPSGELVAETDQFPEFLRPFVRSHTAGLEIFRASPDTVDWLVLSPPANLDLNAPRTGHYQLGGDHVAPQHAQTPGHLSYADLAVAIIDEIERPAHHRTRVSIYD